MRILITGASGLVGHGIVAALKKNYTLLVPDRNELNLLDREQVKQYLKKEQPEMVIHAAGIVGGIAVNMKFPFTFLLANIEMGKNIICESYEFGIKKLINLASSCMYPKDSDKLLTEEMVLTGPLEPTNEGYALAKIVCTRLCEYISRENADFQYKTLIPCNLYGPWDKFISEDAHMIPAVIHKLHIAKTSQIESVSIWGTGQARREFMYSEDLGNCVQFCVKNFESLPSIMNVGLGHDYTVDEYYALIAKVVGYTGGFSHDITKPEGMKRKLTDISRQKKFGWQAQTSLEEGIRRTYEFYLNNVVREG